MLRNRQLANLKFRRQHQIGHYIVDSFCAEHGLNVELDGSVHDTSARQKVDAKRDAYLRSLGHTVLRFPNEHVFNDTENLLHEIVSALPSTSGREAGGEGNNDVMPVLSDKRDIIVLTDEAHRSQYDTLAVNMRSALPNAMFLALTGTPLIAARNGRRKSSAITSRSTTSSNRSRTARPCRSITRTARRSRNS